MAVDHLTEILGLDPAHAEGGVEVAAPGLERGEDPAIARTLPLPRRAGLTPLYWYCQIAIQCSVL